MASVLGETPKRLLVILLLVAILINQTNYLKNRKISRESIRSLSTPTLDCNEEKWFSQDVIKGDYHNPESWGLWTKNGVLSLNFKTSETRYAINFQYSYYSDKVSFDVVDSTDPIALNKSSKGIISLEFENLDSTYRSKIINFKTSGAVRPSSVSINNSDSRKLGVELRSFKFVCFNS